MEIHICIANSNAQDYSISLVSYIAMALFAIKILLQNKYTLLEIVAILAACIIGILSLMATDDMRVLWFAIVICASRDINFEKIVKYSFRTMLVCCVTFISMWALGIIEATTVNSIKGIRYSFGLGHPNMCAAYYTLLMIQYVYLHFERIKAIHLGLFTVGSCIVYWLTKSTTGLITAFAAIVIILVLKYIPLKRMNSKLITIGLICGIVLFTVIPIIYNSNFSAIDNMMTGRLHQANFYYEKYGIGLFGNNINADLNSIYTDNILDMGFAKMLINNGVFYYVAVVLGYVLSMFRACEEKRRDLVALMGCFIIYMFTENVATYIFMNVTMLQFSNYLYGQTKNSAGRKWISNDKRYEHNS